MTLLRGLLWVYAVLQLLFGVVGLILDRDGETPRWEVAFDLASFWTCGASALVFLCVAPSQWDRPLALFLGAVVAVQAWVSWRSRLDLHRKTHGAGGPLTPDEDDEIPLGVLMACADVGSLLLFAPAIALAVALWTR